MQAPILVTGATGFLGRAIVAQAVSESVPIRTTGRRDPTGRLPNFLPVDLADEQLTDSQCDRLVQGARCVIHSAGLAHQFDATQDDFARFERVNVGAPVRLAEAAARQGVERFVHVSSIKVYNPDCPQPIDETTLRDPIGPYAQSKADAEAKLAEVAEQTGLEIVMLRMAVIYGEEDGGNVARLIRAIDNKRFLMIGRGGNRKSLVFRDDAARACLTVARSHTLPSSHRIYNISSDAVPMRDFVGAIYQALGKRSPRLHIPTGCVCLPFAALAKLSVPKVSRKAEKVSETLAKWLVDEAYDGTRFRQDFDFRYRVSLTEGIEREVAWYQLQNQSQLRAA